MSDFDVAIKTILKHEGGYVNDKDDPGGATNYGVSLRFLIKTGDLDRDGFLDGDFDQDGDIDIDDIKKMSLDNAKNIYRLYWWDKYKYALINDDEVATKVFDLAVNMGATQAHKCVQRAIRAANGQTLVDDGILGNQSFAAINNCPSIVLLPAIRSEAAGFYRSLNKPKFIRGWLNRAYA